MSSCKNIHFAAMEEPTARGKYYLAVEICIYREMHKKYPDWLKDMESQTGYTTRFIYLVDGCTFMGKEEAEAKQLELEEKYDDVLQQCEETGDWSNSPFDFASMELLYSS